MGTNSALFANRCPLLEFIKAGETPLRGPHNVIKFASEEAARKLTEEQYYWTCRINVSFSRARTDWEELLNDLRRREASSSAAPIPQNIRKPIWLRMFARSWSWAFVELFWTS